MSNLLNFRFGTYEKFRDNFNGGADGTKAKVYNPGTVYVTSDEQAMYIDLQEAGGTAKRIRIGDIIVQESAKTATPPFVNNAFYYFTSENALVRWDGTEWVQINSLKGALDEVGALDDTVKALSQTVTTEVNRLDQKDIEHSNDIAQLKKDVADRVKTVDFETFKTTNSQEIKSAADAAKAAADAADAAQGTADAANTLAGEAKDLAATKTTMAEVEAKGYATDVNAQTYARNVLGQDGDNASVKTVYGAHAAAKAASDAADAAQGTADAANTLAGEAKDLAATKTTMAEVEAKNYATKTEAQNYANTVLGTSADTASVKTVYGAHAAAKAASDAADAAQGTADTALSTAQAALPKAGGTMTGSINMNSQSITNLADLTSASDGKNAANKNYVDTTVANAIKANDAMTFIGTVGANGDIATLPTTATVYSTTIETLNKKPQKGDTFKVAGAFTFNSINAKKGDLFINAGEDDATPDWKHISSGYEEEYVQELLASGNTLYLTDGVNSGASSAVNSFTIVGDTNSNLQFAVTTSTGGAHTITASMVWGTF